MSNELLDAVQNHASRYQRRVEELVHDRVHGHLIDMFRVRNNILVRIRFRVANEIRPSRSHTARRDDQSAH